MFKITILTDMYYLQVKEQKPETSAPAEASANPGTMGVKMQRSYHLKDEDETEIDPADLAKGLHFMKYSKNP